MRYLHNYYLVYSSPKDVLQRNKIAKELESLNGIRLHLSLWKFTSQNIRFALKIVTNQKPIVLLRSREIFPSKINFDKQVFDLGSVAIFSYRFSKTSSKKRTTLSRMIEKVPKIKIGNALFIIPYLKSSKLNLYKGKVILHDELFRFLDIQDIENNRITHLKIIYPNSHEGLLNLMIIHEKLICSKLISVIRKLTQQINNSEVSNTLKLYKLLSFYKSKYNALQGIAFFMLHSLNVDLSPDLVMVYNALQHCKRTLERKNKQLNIAE